MDRRAARKAPVRRVRVHVELVDDALGGDDREQAHERGRVRYPQLDLGFDRGAGRSAGIGHDFPRYQ